MSDPGKISVIVTGATGMVGEGVMHECLLHPMIEKVLVINRKPGGVMHSKLTEIIHQDFNNISPIIEQLNGYDACLFCAGVTSLGKNEELYYSLTYTLTLNFAKTLAASYPVMVFEYVSGAGTNGTEQGKIMWVRVKGKTENDLAKLPFKRVYNFRPGYMHPTPGLKNVNKYARYVTWLYPLVKWLFPNYVSTLKDQGLAMINAALYGYSKQILEVKDINALAKKV